MTTMNPAKEFRYRRVYISTTQMLNIFQRPVDEFANFWYFKGEPKDVEVVSCYYDAMYASICFIISHPSFEKVKIGEAPPVHDQLMTVTMQRVPNYEHMKRS